MDATGIPPSSSTARASPVEGALLDETPDEWRRIIDVNLTSAYLVARAAIPGMRRQGDGRVVLVASVNGRFGGSALSGPAYAASKGGLLTLSRFIAREHAGRRDSLQCRRPRSPRHPHVGSPRP